MQLLYSCCLFCVSILSHTQLLSSTSSVVSAAACSLVLWASRELRREPRQSHCGIVSPPLQPSCCCCALHPLQRTSTPPQRGQVDLLPLYTRALSSRSFVIVSHPPLAWPLRALPALEVHSFYSHLLPSSAALVGSPDFTRRIASSGSLIEDSSPSCRETSRQADALPLPWAV
jgi:hypothetical protein